MEIKITLNFTVKTMIGIRDHERVSKSELSVFIEFVEHVEMKKDIIAGFVDYSELTKRVTTCLERSFMTLEAAVIHAAHILDSTAGVIRYAVRLTKRNNVSAEIRK